MRLARQLAKEFWLPAVVSILWAGVGLVWTGHSPVVAAVGRQN